MLKVTLHPHPGGGESTPSIMEVDVGRQMSLHIYKLHDSIRVLVSHHYLAQNKEWKSIQHQKNNKYGNMEENGRKKTEEIK